MGWELYCDLEVLEYKVTILLGIIVTKAGHGTPTPAQILVIFVWDCTDFRTKVECDCPEH